MKHLWQLKQNPGKKWITAGLLALVTLSLTSLKVSAQERLEDWKAPARKARVKNPVPADQTALRAGREMFTVACAPCHGAAGRGDGPAAVSLERKPGNLTDAARMWAQPDGALFWKISNGRSPMPAFDTAYSEKQRWQIINYVRTLAPKTKVVAAK